MKQLNSGVLFHRLLPVCQQKQGHSFSALDKWLVGKMKLAIKWGGTMRSMAQKGVTRSQCTQRWTAHFSSTKPLLGSKHTFCCSKCFKSREKIPSQRRFQRFFFCLQVGHIFWVEPMDFCTRLMTWRWCSNRWGWWRVAVAWMCLFAMAWSYGYWG